MTVENLHKSDARRVNASVMFCDLRGFTALFDEVDPLEAFAFANSVLHTLATTVEENGGYIDKFTGDGLMAHFGVSELDADHAVSACRCALRLKQTEVKINSTRHIADLNVISLGIGVSSGWVAAGTLSTKTHKEFTIYGDVVNTASRIESLTRLFHVDILVSDSTWIAARETFEMMPLPSTKLRGKRGEHLLHWLLPTNLLPD